MKKLYYVTVTFEAEDTLPVMAEDEIDARKIAGNNIHESDFDYIDKTFFVKEADNRTSFFSVRPYNQNSYDSRTCSEIIEDQIKEKKRIELEALEPKLPGFES